MIRQKIDRKASFEDVLWSSVRLRANSGIVIERGVSFICSASRQRCSASGCFHDSEIKCTNLITISGATRYPNVRRPLRHTRPIRFDEGEPFRWLAHNEYLAFKPTRLITFVVTKLLKFNSSRWIEECGASAFI